MELLRCVEDIDARVLLVVVLFCWLAIELARRMPPLLADDVAVGFCADNGGLALFCATLCFAIVAVGLMIG